MQFVFIFTTQVSHHINRPTGGIDDPPQSALRTRRPTSIAKWYQAAQTGSSCLTLIPRVVTRCRLCCYHKNATWHMHWLLLYLPLTLCTWASFSHFVTTVARQYRAHCVLGAGQEIKYLHSKSHPGHSSNTGWLKISGASESNLIALHRGSLALPETISVLARFCGIDQPYCVKNSAHTTYEHIFTVESIVMVILLKILCSVSGLVSVNAMFEENIPRTPCMYWSDACGKRR